MKEEFHEFRKRQAKRRRSEELESACWIHHLRAGIVLLLFCKHVRVSRKFNINIDSPLRRTRQYRVARKFSIDMASLSRRKNWRYLLCLLLIISCHPGCLE
jgi:hypothetical protein